MSVDVRCDQLLRLIKYAIDRFRGDLKFPYIIFIDRDIVQECATRASVTLLEYNMSGDQVGVEEHEFPNHFKEAGHYAYWIARLKPIRTIDREQVSVPLSAGQVPHNTGALETFIRDGRRPDILLNEYAALAVAKLLVSTAEKQLLKEKLKSLTKDEGAGLIAAFQSTRTRIISRTEMLSPQLLRSFRYDVHSTNSLALLFEALLGTGLVTDDA